MSDDMKTFIKKLRSALVVANVRHVGIQFRHEEVVNLMHYLGDVEGIIEQSSLIEKELEAELDKYRWIPVEERLPEYGKAVLIKTTTSVVPRIGRHSPTIPQWATTDGLYFHGNGYKDVTHWMPLPEPPEVR